MSVVSQTPHGGNQDDGDGADQPTPVRLSSPQVFNGGSQQSTYTGSGGLNNSPFGNTLTQPFSIKLDRNNFTLWRNLVSTMSRALSLEGYINGTRICPPKLIPAPGATIEGISDPTLMVNPEFERWIVCDQLLMGWLYGSMTEAIATEVMGCTSK
uniref:Retrotransposon Copia-like N-terminal domain-containing protein n=1 Tax=Cannabis sativa TaxID=3483 RepID=A0A803PR44_CANSA